ncbi:hypothetical protein F5I97DRAFT_1926317 [Phlebopus sp. FC_14]|nr:hypothetical protein F5I97DRAFT_1926317 [Phlebopus sp. FC_14]
MSFTSHEIGTLIVVVLKAKNLPNKRHIGKQAPYCLITLNEDKRRTKVIKRGGQHPEWDEEFRFAIYEDVEGSVIRSAQGSDIPPPLPPKKKGPKKIKGGNLMRLQCYADDARDPDFIGETLVDLTEALTKGETDEWFTLMNKDKYSGEVYLELTFWSNEPPPEKKPSRKPTTSSKNYGGPGSFVPASGSSSSLNGSSAHSTPSRVTPSSSSTEVNHLNSLPSSLRASGSRPELYAPPYEQRNRVSPVEHLTSSFAELGVMDHRRRESYPPANTLRPSTSSGFSAFPPQPSLEEHGDPSAFFFDDAITPTATAPPSNINNGPALYYPSYEDGSVSGHPRTPSVRHHGSRYSMPSSSSGFVPITIPAPPPYGGVSDLPSHGVSPGHSVPCPPSPHPIAPSSYVHHHHLPQSAYTSAPTNQTPFPVSAPPPLRVSHSMSASQVHSYKQYPAPEQAFPFPSQPILSQDFVNVPPPPLPPASLPPSIPTTLPYPPYVPPTPSPSREYPPPTPSQSFFSSGSRPLPQPGPSQRDRRLSAAVPPSSSFPHQVNGTSSNQPIFPSSSSYPAILPAAPQTYQRRPSSRSYSPSRSMSHESSNSRPPPLPAPPVQAHGNPPPTRPTLPQPPMGYRPVQPVYQQLPPPPPALDISHHGQPHPPLPSSSFSNISYVPGSGPRPSQPHANYWQPLPTPPVQTDWH